MKLKTALATLIVLAMTATAAAAQVQVRGYYRSDGTYVAPHTRSSPDGDRSNNYGPSSRRSSSSLYSPPPQQRDHDNDGIANMYDRDDDNDGVSDNADRSQYGRTTTRRSGSAWPN
jgi:opacity protein-like surface antigen